MAVHKNGQLLGKLGNYTTYPLNDQIVSRSIGISDKKPTRAQLSARKQIKVVSAFLDPLKEFIEAGFALDAAKHRKSAHNQATSYNYKNGLEYKYPRTRVCFKNVLVTMGTMPLVPDAKVEMVTAGLRFTWNPESVMEPMHWNDRVIMLAYFPTLKNAVYELSGAKRNTGEDLLPIKYARSGFTAEIYISFMSVNRKNIMNSIYLGSLSW